MARKADSGSRYVRLIFAFMMKRCAELSCVALGCSLLVAVPARAADKLPIVLECQCDDAVGQLFATSTRDVLTTSPRYALSWVADVKDATGKTVDHNFVVNVVTMDSDDRSEYRGHSTVMSVVFEYNGMLLDHWVQTCGKDVVKSCAASLMSNVDRDIDQLARAAR